MNELPPRPLAHVTELYEAGFIELPGLYPPRDEPAAPAPATPPAVQAELF